MPNWELTYNDIVRQVHPLNDEDSLGISYSRHEDQYFLRGTIDTVSFNGKTAREILNQDLNQEFNLVFRHDNKIEYRGIFYRKKVVVNPSSSDDVTITITLESDGQYRKLLKKHNEKINVLESCPVGLPISYKLKPILQVYVSGTNYITNIQDNLSWNVNLQNTPIVWKSFLTDEIKYGFGKADSIYFVSGESTEPVGGEYQKTLSTLGSTTPYDYLSNGTYNIGYLGSFLGNHLETWNTNKTLMFYVNSTDLTDAVDYGSSFLADNGMTLTFFGVYKDKNSTILAFIKRIDINPNITGEPSPNGVLTPLSTQNPQTYTKYYDSKDGDAEKMIIRVGISLGIGDIKFLSELMPLARITSPDRQKGFIDSNEVKLYSVDSDEMVILTNRSIVSRMIFPEDADGRTKIEGEDATELNEIYQYRIAVESLNITPSDETSDVDLGYGVFANDAGSLSGKFVKPPSGGLNQIYLDDTRYVSLWCPNVSIINNSISQTKFVVSDVYDVVDVINVFLNEIDERITFASDPLHSQFMFGNTPVGQLNNRFVLIPKSNVMQVAYTRAATKGELSCKEIFDYLYDQFKLKWHIDDDFNLIIEHEEYYKNGRKYINGSGSIEEYDHPMIDRSMLEYAMTQEYDLDEFTGGKNFDYQDPVRSIFESVIKYTDGLTIDEEVKVVSINTFNPDIFFIITNKSEVNRVGFVPALVDEDNEVSYKNMFYRDRSVSVLNGGLSFKDTVKYHLYCCPSSSVKIDGIDTTSKTNILPIKANCESTFPIDSSIIHSQFLIGNALSLIHI